MKMQPKKINNSLFKNFIFVILIFLAIGAIFSLLFYPDSNASEISATQLVNDINQDKIKTITISGDSIDIVYNDDTVATSMKENNTSITDLLTNLGVNQESLQKVSIDIKEKKANFWDDWGGIIVFGILPLVIFGLVSSLHEFAISYGFPECEREKSFERVG